MNTFKSTLKRLNNLETYLGSDNEDVPINKDAIINMRRLLVEINQNNIIIPEVFPHYGGGGLQFEWEYDWYLEIDCTGNTFDFFAIYKNNCSDFIENNNLSLNETIDLLKKYTKK